MLGETRKILRGGREGAVLCLRVFFTVGDFLGYPMNIEIGGVIIKIVSGEVAAFINKPSRVIPAKAGIQSGNMITQIFPIKIKFQFSVMSGLTRHPGGVVSRTARSFCLGLWIPAFAGMTEINKRRCSFYRKLYSQTQLFLITPDWRKIVKKGLHRGRGYSKILLKT